MIDKIQYKNYRLFIVAIIFGVGSGSVPVAAQFANAVDDAQPSLVHLYRMNMYYTNAWFVELEESHGTEGQFYGILEGSVLGDNISGEFHIVNFPRRRTDGNFLPDARGVLKTDDGALIMLDLKGISYYADDAPSPEVLFGLLHYTNSYVVNWAPRPDDF